MELPEPAGSKYPSPAVNYVDRAEFIRKLNEILPQIDVTAIDSEKIDRSRSYCRKKCDEISTNLAAKIFDITTPGVREVAKENCEQEIVNQLKEKFAETTKKEQKIKILSVLPRSWSARKISKEFSTTVYLPLLTKKLVEENGIMCGPKKRIGTKTIDEKTVKCVKEFYSSDEISRVCPGKRDYVTVDENNIKIAKQRRLILMNLKEAYAVFKEQHINLKVGFSKFASLRPPECILALDTAGTHSVCVCMYHQNVKLIFESMKRIFGVDSYRVLFKRMMCAEPSDECFLNECEQCPGVKEMEKYLCEIMTAIEIESVTFKQWITQNGKARFGFV